MARIIGQSFSFRPGTPYYVASSNLADDLAQDNLIRRSQTGISILRPQEIQQLTPVHHDRINSYLSQADTVANVLQPVIPAYSKARYYREGARPAKNMPLNATDLYMSALAQNWENAQLSQVMDELINRYPQSAIAQPGRLWGGTPQQYQQSRLIGDYAQEIRANPHDVRDYVLQHGALPVDPRDAMFAGRIDPASRYQLARDFLNRQFQL